jgi:hypothetical protein
VEENEDRDELIFSEHLTRLTKAVIGVDASDNQKEYLKGTPKPEKMSVKQWVNQIKNINSYLQLMDPDTRPFTEKEIIAKVITKNIPAAWKVQFRLANFHLKTRIDDIISGLMVIEENIKTHPKSNQEKKKQFKNPCKLHNGGCEWDDCRQNPRNQKNEDKKNENNRNRNSNGNSNCTHKENRGTERNEDRTRNHSNSQNRNNGDASDSENEFHFINEQNEAENNKKNET